VGTGVALGIGVSVANGISVASGVCVGVKEGGAGSGVNVGCRARITSESPPRRTKNPTMQVKIIIMPVKSQRATDFRLSRKLDWDTGPMSIVIEVNGRPEIPSTS
jgi:hypothetical protein